MSGRVVAVGLAAAALLAAGLLARPVPGARAGGAGPEARAQEADPGEAATESRAAPGGAPAPRPPPPSPEEIARYREAAERSERPRDWYNLGAALLLAGDRTGARGPLEQAAGGGEEGVRRPALYNLGVAEGAEGRHGELAPEARRALLLEARSAFRAVLRADPADEDARWNLELVERWLEQESGGGGGAEEEGGGGGGGGEGGGAADPGSSGSETPSLTRREAEELLDAASRAERGVQEKRLDRERSRDPVVERDW